MDELSTETKIEQLENRMDTVVNSFEKLQLKLDQLIGAIRGNDTYGTKGHAERLRELEKDQKAAAIERMQVDRRIDKIYYRVLGICAGVSITTVIFAWLFTNVVIDQQRNIEMPKINPQALIIPLLPEKAMSAPIVELPPLKVSPAEAALDTFIEPKTKIIQ